MLIWNLKDQGTVELRFGGLLLGYVGLCSARRGRARIGLSLISKVTVTPSTTAVADLMQSEQPAEFVRSIG